MNAIKSHFWAIMNDGTQSPIDHRWSQIVKDNLQNRVIALAMKSDNGPMVLLERSNTSEQFFQFRQRELIMGLGDFDCTNCIGKTINEQGDCLVIIHDCKEDVFVTNIGNVKSLIRGGPLNFDLLGLKILAGN